MTADLLLQTLASGVLIGLVYALVAVGLTLIFGVMDIVNFAHGEFLMLGMYLAFWMYALLALDPLWTLPVTTLGLFIVGATLYRGVIKRIIGAPMLYPSTRTGGPAFDATMSELPSRWKAATACARSNGSMPPF